MINNRQFVSCDDLRTIRSHSRDMAEERLPPCDLHHDNWFLLDAMESHHNTGVTLPMKSFNHIALEVLDVEKSRKFYVEILGFKQVARPPFDSSGYWLHGYNLSLHLVETTVPLLRKKLIATRIHHFSFCLPRVDHIAFVSDNLNIIREVLDREKVYYKADCLESSGISQIFFFDPDGNVIEISNCAPEVGEVLCSSALIADVRDDDVDRPASSADNLFI